MLGQQSAYWIFFFFFFSYFPQKTGFDISYKLSPLICQILFTGENISSMCLLNEARVWYFIFFYFFFFFFFFVLTANFERDKPDIFSRKINGITLFWKRSKSEVMFSPTCMYAVSTTSFKRWFNVNGFNALNQRWNKDGLYRGYLIISVLDRILFHRMNTKCSIFTNGDSHVWKYKFWCSWVKSNAILHWKKNQIFCFF